VTSELSRRPIVIIEDSDEDYEVTVWALRRAGVTNPMYRCANLAAIMELLSDPSNLPAELVEPYPLLVLLDLNLPGTDGRETLFKMRNHRLWQAVPVIIISTSGRPADISRCYRLGAAGYILKPLDLDAFAAAIKHLAAYWLRTVAPSMPNVAVAA
jgi:DNA-binding NarL/FixJ family response regulator